MLKSKQITNGSIHCIVQGKINALWHDLCVSRPAKLYCLNSVKNCWFIREYIQVQFVLFSLEIVVLCYFAVSSSGPRMTGLKTHCYNLLTSY